MLLTAPHALATLDLFAAAAKKSSGGSSVFLIFIIIIAGVYLLFIAPQRRKQRAKMNEQRTFEVGDEVVTSGGIYGRVASSEGERVALDIADGVVIDIARTAVARRVEPTAPTAVAGDGVDGEDSGTGSDDHGWRPPAEASGANGTAPAGSSEDERTWGDPWTPPVDGEHGAPPSGGSA